MLCGSRRPNDARKLSLFVRAEIGQGRSNGAGWAANDSHAGLPSREVEIRKATALRAGLIYVRGVDPSRQQVVRYFWRITTCASTDART